MSIIYVNPFQFAAAPVGPTDPYFSNVSLLLHGDGTTIVDSSPSPKTVTPYGDAQINTTATDPFGRTGIGVIAFDGTGDYLGLGGELDFAFGSLDFTIEFFFYQLATGGSLIDTRDNTGTYRLVERYQIYLNSSNQLVFQTYIAARATNALNTLQWYHAAVCRSSGVTRLFLGGVQAGSNITDNTNYGIGANRPIIGNDLLASSGFNGYIDELRITKGVARYTTNFTPPTAPFPDA